ncbi:MAG TPA: S26 family signal peptidase [Sumerlaeia bacterium]|nr:S26 family signal peptidase [Sumerlaeia bacterium]
MRKCPICEFVNREPRETCLKCGATLVHRDDLAPKGAVAAEGVDIVSLTGRVVSRLCRRCLRALESPVPQGLPHRFYCVAGLLGVVPGLGQIYNRQPKKAVYFVLGFLFFALLAARFITTPHWGNVFVAAAALVALAASSDAMVTAERINGRSFSLRDRFALLLYPIFLFGAVGFILSLLAAMQFPVFTHFYIGANYMAPALMKGDRILGEALSYWIRRPRPGDVVHYDPPRWLQGPMQSVNPRNGWERVMAVGGETLRRVDGIFYVDGRRLSRDYYPLATKDLPADFRIACPEGNYIVLMSSRAEDHSLITRLSGMADTAPPLGGPAWEKACVVSREEIFERTLFIYWPTVRRRILTPSGPRLVDE